MTVHVKFPDVLDLVPQSTVKVSDVTVGKVTDVSLDGYTADVTMLLRNDVDLPDNAEAEIRQTSLLGEKFVSLAPPTENPSPNKLGDGDRIDISATNRTRRSKRSSVRSACCSTVAVWPSSRPSRASSTRPSTAGRAVPGPCSPSCAPSPVSSTRTRPTSSTPSSRSTAGQGGQQAEAGHRVRAGRPARCPGVPGQPAGRPRQDAQGARTLGNVGTRVIRASKTATIDALTQLQPVLSNLAKTGDDFAKSFNVFLTYPFVDEVVGRNPEVARNLHMGDYTNLSIKLDIDLGGPKVPAPNPTDACIPLKDIPDDGPIPPLDQLCEGALKAVQKCLNNPTVENCRGLPDVVIKTVCQTTPLPGLCPAGGGGGGPLPTPTLPVPIPSLPLGRTGPGPALEETMTLDRLMGAYNPILVGLLLPGVAE
jgi:phospholipid/cholesterol/gamma-HCH transport system substrate-binding protein